MEQRLYMAAGELRGVHANNEQGAAGCVTDGGQALIQASGYLLAEQ